MKSDAVIVFGFHKSQLASKAILQKGVFSVVVVVHSIAMIADAISLYDELLRKRTRKLK